MFNEKAFRRAVEDSNLTLADIAERLGISKATLYRKINGKSDFYRSEIQIIAQAIGEEKIFDIFFSSKVA